MWYRLLVCLCILFVYSGCGSKGESYFRKHGNEVKVELLEILAKTNAIQDVLSNQEQLASLFDELAVLSIEVSSYQTATNTSWDTSKEEIYSSEKLEEEFRRVLQIPGARAIIEKSQARALERLHTFEKAKSKNSVKR